MPTSRGTGYPFQEDEVPLKKNKKEEGKECVWTWPDPSHAGRPTGFRVVSLHPPESLTLGGVQIERQVFRPALGRAWGASFDYSLQSAWIGGGKDAQDGDAKQLGWAMSRWSA